MLEMYLLEQLLVIAESSSLSQAAKKLHMTQPTLTRSCQKMEKLLGVTLLEKSRQGMTLNENGKLVAEYAEKIVQLQKELQATLQKQNVLHVGFSAPGPKFLMEDFMQKKYIPAFLSTEGVSSEVLKEQLRKGMLDMIVTDTPCEDLDICSRLLITEKLYVSAPKEHPLTKYSSITFEQLNGCTFLMVEKVGVWKEVVEKAMPSSKFLLQDSSENLAQIILFSSILSFATNITLAFQHKEESREYISISDSSASIPFYIQCLKGNEAFIQPVLEAMAQQKGIKI
ncbi:MAG: LysR family transcriptional regulator [Bulleidia sp.]|nr:LysR family transcriptional regulator [Bulleidia sp.]